MDYLLTQMLLQQLPPQFIPQPYKDDPVQAMLTYDGPAIKGILSDNESGAFVEVQFNGPSVFAFAYDLYPDRNLLASITCEYNDDDPQQPVIRVAGEIVDPKNHVLLSAELAKLNDYAIFSEIQPADN